MEIPKLGHPSFIISGLILLSTFICSDAKSEVPYGIDTENGTCESLSEGPLFQQPTGSKALEMELITNYAHLVKAAAIADSPLHKKRFKRRQNFEKKLGYNLGVLRISPQDTNEEYHPVVLHPRGHSRRSSWVCPTAPPLRVFFLDRKIKQSLDAALEQKNVHPGEPNYLQMYYNEFLKINILPTEKTMAPDEGIFSKLGSELKLVTHCDAQTGEDDDPDLEPIEKRRIQAVFREFALYEMLQPLRWPVERVRLLNISYFNESGKPVFHKQNQSEKIKKMVGFFREPQKSVAKRCGLDHKAFIKRGREVNAAFLSDKAYKLGQDLMKKSLDQLSWFHVRLMNALIGNKDYAVHSAFSNRNVAMYLAGNTNSEDLKDLKLITSPYDFDLSKFAYPSAEDQPTGEDIPKELEKELLDMLDETLRINENLSDRWIKTTIHIDKKKLRTSVQRAIRAMPQMMDVIESSQTEKDFKRPVLKMLNLFLKRLEKAEKNF